MQVAFETIENRLRSFETAVGLRSGEPWKDNHVLAMACYDFESVLQGAISLYDGIEELHVRLREYQAQHPEQAGTDFTQLIHEWYAKWLKQSSMLERELLSFEQAGFVVKFAVEYRRLVRDTSDALLQWHRPSRPVRPLKVSDITIRRPSIPLPDDLD